MAIHFGLLPKASARATLATKGEGRFRVVEAEGEGMVKVCVPKGSRPVK